MKGLRLLLCVTAFAVQIMPLHAAPAPVLGSILAAPLPPCPPRPKDPNIPWPPYPCKGAPSASTARARADLRVRLTAAPSATVPPKSLVAYQLVVRNIGQGRAGTSQIALPFAGAQQTVLDTAFSRADGWVSDIRSDAIELRLGPLAHDETVTATVRLRTSASAALGANLTTRATVGWSDARGNGTARSNQVALVVAQAATDRATSALSVEPATGSTAVTFEATYGGFCSNERVSLWYHSAEGAAVSLGVSQADAQGHVGYSLPAKKLADGRYTIVMYGQFSQVSATGEFTVSAPATP